MKHNTSILHLLDRQDRKPFVNALRDYYPKANIIAGVIHEWDVDTQGVRQIKGAIGSHVRAILSHEDRSIPTLVLEDDARINPENIADFDRVIALPDDCGMLLVGGETPVCYSSGNGFYEVLAPYHGVQAALYNTPLLEKKGVLAEWLLFCWCQPISEKHHGLESSLLAVLQKCGLRIYRLKTMAFSTHASYSQRMGGFMLERGLSDAEDIPRPPAFGDDVFLAKSMADIIRGNQIEVVVETGTWKGGTALAFAEMAKEVQTFEIDRNMFCKTKALIGAIGANNIIAHCGDSAEGIKFITPRLEGRRVLYYLDAHKNDFCKTYTGCPLLQELESISKIQGPKPIIVIHDCEVPGRPEFGFDVIDGQTLNIDYVREGLDKVYPNGWNHTYNTKATGAHRGVLLVTPKQ